MSEWRGEAGRAGPSGWEAGHAQPVLGGRPPLWSGPVGFTLLALRRRVVSFRVSLRSAGVSECAKE